MPRSARTLCLLVGLAGLAACGGQTGEGDEGGNECTDLPPEPLVDGEPTPLGFSVVEVLEFANRQQIQLRRSASQSAPDEATLIVRARRSSARFIATRPRRDIGRPEACRGRVELDAEVDLTLHRANGDLEWSASGRLKVDSRFRVELTAAFAEPTFDALRTFDLAPEERLARVELRALLTPAGSAGTLTANVEQLVSIGPQPEPTGDAPRARDFMTTRDALVALWPPDSPCSEGELPVSRSESLFELTPEQVVEMHTAPRTVHWNDGSTTTLRLHTAQVAGACLSDDNSAWSDSFEYPIAPENPAVFGVPIELSVATEDGRLTSHFSTVLRYRARKTGVLERAWIVHSATLGPGDAGGWSTSAADLGTRRTTYLHLAWPNPSGGDGNQLTLYGPPGPGECSSNTRTCTGTPAVSPKLLSGTIE